MTSDSFSRCLCGDQRISHGPAGCTGGLFGNRPCAWGCKDFTPADPHTGSRMEPEPDALAALAAVEPFRGSLVSATVLGYMYVSVEFLKQIRNAYDAGQPDQAMAMVDNKVLDLLQEIGRLRKLAGDLAHWAEERRL